MKGDRINSILSYIFGDRKKEYDAEGQVVAVKESENVWRVVYAKELKMYEDIPKQSRQ
ncbi:MAG: hypothetical protein M1122_01835 [Candidatus Marsarchaeota archaeon]|nr:hypothetical protein [Candidatus Marsarchaeota archaeon]